MSNLSLSWLKYEFDKVFKVVSTKKHQINKSNYLDIGQIPIIDQGKKRIVGYTNELSKRYVNTIGVIVFGDHTLTFKHIDFDFVVGADGTKVLKLIDSEKFDLKFLFYQFLSRQYKILGYRRHFKIIKKDAFNIPPLVEQKRIVAKIDTLFAKIDKAISLTEESLKQAKNLLPSVLKEVFEKGKADGWEERKLGEIAFLKSGSTPRRSNKSFWEGGTIPWLKSGELNDLMEIKENSEFITEKALNETSVKLFTKGTLLIAMYGATAGKLGILSIDATTNQAVCSIQNKKGMFNNHYMFYFLYSIREKIISDSFGGAQPNISKTYLENLILHLPDLSTQDEVVSLCDELSLNALQTQSKFEEQLTYLKNLKSSILSKAFAGEL